MIIKRQLREYKKEEIDDAILSLQEILRKLEKDLDRVERHKKEYESQASYKLDKSMIEDEMSEYKLEIEMLKARKNTL